MKILVVDDSAIARKFLIKSLPADLELHVKECSDGLQGVSAYIEINPDIVFLDLTMPVMDGITALKKIRDFDKDAVVFILSADIQKTTQEKVMSMGAMQFLKKPPNKEIIGTIVRDYHKFLNRG